MVDFELVYLIPLCVVFLIVQVILHPRPIDTLLRTLAFVYFVLVIAVTLFPIPTDSVEDFINAGVEFKNNFVPFKSIIDIVSSQPLSIALKQVGGNVILMMPLGFLAPLICRREITWKKILWIGILFSLSIEVLQFTFSYMLGFTYKITDVDDLLLNSLGAVIGYCFYRLFKWGFKKV